MIWPDPIASHEAMLLGETAGIEEIAGMALIAAGVLIGSGRIIGSRDPVPSDT